MSLIQSSKTLPFLSSSPFPPSPRSRFLLILQTCAHTQSYWKYSAQRISSHCPCSPYHRHFKRFPKRRGSFFPKRNQWSPEREGQTPGIFYLFIYFFLLKEKKDKHVTSTAFQHFRLFGQPRFAPGRFSSVCAFSSPQSGTGSPEVRLALTVLSPRGSWSPLAERVDVTSTWVCSFSRSPEPASREDQRIAGAASRSLWPAVCDMRLRSGRQGGARKMACASISSQSGLPSALLFLGHKKKKKSNEVEI